MDTPKSKIKKHLLKNSIILALAPTLRLFWLNLKVETTKKKNIRNINSKNKVGKKHVEKIFVVRQVGGQFYFKGNDA